MKIQYEDKNLLIFESDLYVGLSENLSSIAFAVLLILLHPIILFIYLLVVRKKFRKNKTNDDILDEDF